MRNEEDFIHSFRLASFASSHGKSKTGTLSLRFEVYWKQNALHAIAKRQVKPRATLTFPARKYFIWWKQ